MILKDGYSRDFPFGCHFGACYLLTLSIASGGGNGSGIGAAGFQGLDTAGVVINRVAVVDVDVDVGFCIVGSAGVTAMAAPSTVIGIVN